MHEWKQECLRIESRGGTCLFYETETGCCTSEYPGTCRPIVEECKSAQITMIQDPKDKNKEIEKPIPCQRIIAGELCSSFINPAAIWCSSPCPFAGRVKSEDATTKKVNPLKASKRAAKGKKG